MIIVYFTLSIKTEDQAWNVFTELHRDDVSWSCQPAQGPWRCRRLHRTQQSKLRFMHLNGTSNETQDSTGMLWTTVPRMHQQFLKWKDKSSCRALTKTEQRLVVFYNVPLGRVFIFVIQLRGVLYNSCAHCRRMIVTVGAGSLNEIWQAKQRAAGIHSLWFRNWHLITVKFVSSRIWERPFQMFLKQENQSFSSAF